MKMEMLRRDYLRCLSTGMRATRGHLLHYINTIIITLRWASGFESGFK
jgi:hypothetical protein